MSWTITLAVLGLCGLGLFLYPKFEDWRIHQKVRESRRYKWLSTEMRQAVDAAWSDDYTRFYQYFSPTLPPQVRALRLGGMPGEVSWYTAQLYMAKRHPDLPGGWMAVAHAHLDLAYDLRGDHTEPPGRDFAERSGLVLESVDTALEFDPKDIEAKAHAAEVLLLGDSRDHARIAGLLDEIVAVDPQHWRARCMRVRLAGPRHGGSFEAMLDRAREISGSAPDGSALHALIGTAHSQRLLHLWRWKGRTEDALALSHDAPAKAEVAAAWDRFAAAPCGRDEVFALTQFAISLWNYPDPERARAVCERLGNRFLYHPWQEWRGDPVVAFNDARKEAGLPQLAEEQLQLPG
ncbi:MAG: hypothetical protein EP330_13690 [Deltaproteobacteria bacterium]|nr:MAG: hypothetical protein EP330_13690 [Deltaproteobacteria bacterium]